MDAIRAVCACRDMSEADLILAVKRGRFQFIEKWGILTWMIVLLLSFATGGIWLGVVLGWHYGDILNPKYHCNHCDATIAPKQFRL
jgi:hypothetical protein